mmetsp:Transcript_6862/g.11551  ORF Transcript_6862/g.11551 Transcript_6862/m.11551 type:complete len:224 (+) Transcript_6862:607-1278(+)
MSPGSLRQRDIGSALPKSPRLAVAVTLAGVVLSRRSLGSKWSSSSREKISKPSVDAEAQERPSGAKRTHAQRIASLLMRSLRRDSSRGGGGGAEGSSESISTMRSSMAPASVSREELSCMRTPSSATLLLRTNFRRSKRSHTSYRQTNFELPPARRQLPSAEKARLRKHFPALEFLALTLDSTERPPAMSALPSIVPVCCASFASQRAICPSRVAQARREPSG